jgi:hypothetical protein
MIKVFIRLVGKWRDRKDTKEWHSASFPSILSFLLSKGKATKVR